MVKIDIRLYYIKNTENTNMNFFKKSEYCGGLLRAFICSSKDEDCMMRYKYNTLVYACMLRNNRMTFEEYRNQYNPHYLLNDKIHNGENTIGDKEKRIENFKKYGKFDNKN